MKMSNSEVARFTCCHKKRERQTASPQTKDKIVCFEAHFKFCFKANNRFELKIQIFVLFLDKVNIFKVSFCIN